MVDKTKKSNIMPKIFISGRVSGIKYRTAQKNFNALEKRYRKEGFKVVNPLRLCKRRWSWLRCMAICLWNLVHCDMVHAMPNHRKSRGARIEVKVAKLLGIPVIFD
jgi:hypothetical protein